MPAPEVPPMQPLMPTHAHPRDASTRAPRGFTLVELLIVLGIIAVLITIVVVVGQGVAQSAKRNATVNTLQVLDEAMAAYVASEDASFPKFITPDPARPTAFAAVFDGVAQQLPGTAAGTFKPINTVGLFMLEASKVPRSRDILAKLPAKFVRNVTIEPALPGAGDQPSLPTVFDAWDRPIRLVLPFSDGIITGPKAGTAAAITDFRPIADVFGATAGPTFITGDLRRNNTTVRDATTCNVTAPADSDGGRCVGNKPYFYSVGADGLAGISTPASCGNVNGTQDNIYTTPPTFPK